MCHQVQIDVEQNEKTMLFGIMQVGGDVDPEDDFTDSHQEIFLQVIREEGRRHVL